MDVKQWLDQRFSPVCLVVASHRAEELAKLNGMSAYQLVKPFSTIEFDLFVRGVSNNDPIQLKNFQFRFMRPDNIREFSPDARVDYFTKQLAQFEASDQKLSDGISEALAIAIDGKDLTRPCFSGVMGSALLQQTYPKRHTEFFKDYVAMLRTSYFDTLDHPVGILHVLAATKDPSLVKEQIGLIGANIMTGCRSITPAIDDDVCKVYVLLHDPNFTTNAEAEACLKVLTTAVGQPQNCAALTINTYSGANTATKDRPADPSLWISANSRLDSYTTDGSRKLLDLPGQGAHASTSVAGKLGLEDLGKLRKTVSQLLGKAVVPFMERKVREYVTHIQVNRQTTFSKVAAWFRSDKASPEKGSSPAFVIPSGQKEPHYVNTSLEMRMRKTGDILFFLHDFEGAQQYFRMLREDLQATRHERSFNAAYMAAAQEGIGLCYYFQGRLPLPFGKDECRLETARENYTQASVYSFAFRTSLLLLAICRFRVGPANDRSLVVIGHALENVRRNAMYRATLNEVAAMCCLVQNPPHAGTSAATASVPSGFAFSCSPRKFALKIVMAADAFYEKKITFHALRCYRLALSFYRSLGGATWTSMAEKLYLRVSTLCNSVPPPLISPRPSADPAALADTATESLSLLSAAIGMGLPFIGDAKNPSLKEHLDTFFTSVESLCEVKNITHAPYLCVPSVSPPEDIILSEFGEDTTTLQYGKHLGQKLDDEFANIEMCLRGYLGSHTKDCNGMLLPVRKPDEEASHLVRKNPNRAKAGPHNAVVGEPIEVVVALRNPLAVNVAIANVVLLVVPVAAVANAESGAVCYNDIVPAPGGIPQDIVLDARKSSSHSFTYTPRETGKQWIVGLQWNFGSSAGRFIFDTDMSNDLNKEQAFSRALNRALSNGKIHLHPSFVEVDALAARGSLKLTLDPPLPAHWRDGQVFKTSLQIENTASSAAIDNIVVQLSSANIHLVHWEHFHDSRPDTINLVQHGIVEAGSSISIPVVFSANFTSGGNSTERQYNYFAACAAYSSLGSDGSESPTSPSSPSARFKVRLHRFVRRVVVRPSLEIASTVLPPTSPNGGSIVSVRIANASYRIDSPLRMCRFMVTTSGWRAKPLGIEELIADNALACYFTQGHAVSLPIMVQRDASVGDSADHDEAHPCHRVLSDQQCLSIDATLPESKRIECEAVLGAGLGSTRHDTVVPHWRFCVSSTKGCGELGAAPPIDEDGFVFYEDGAGGNLDNGDGPCTEEKKRHTEEYAPLVLAVAWAADEDGDTHFGQCYHFLDVRALTKQHHSVPSADLLACVGNSETANPTIGLVNVTAMYPNKCEGPVGGGGFATSSVSLQLTNQCVEPLDLTVVVKAETTHSHRPYMYCGRSKIKSLDVAPNATVTIDFPIQFFSVGTFDVNQFLIKGTPSKREGIAPVTKEVKLTGTTTPWPITVLYKSAGEQVPTASPSRPKGRVRQLSRIGAGGVPMPMLRKPVAEELTPKTLDTTPPATTLQGVTPAPIPELQNNSIVTQASTFYESSSNSGSSAATDDEGEEIPLAPNPESGSSEDTGGSEEEEEENDIPTADSTPYASSPVKEDEEETTPQSSTQLGAVDASPPQALDAQERSGSDLSRMKTSTNTGVFDDELSSEEEREIVMRHIRSPRPSQTTPKVQPKATPPPAADPTTMDTGDTPIITTGARNLTARDGDADDDSTDPSGAPCGNALAPSLTMLLGDDAEDGSEASPMDQGTRADSWGPSNTSDLTMLLADGASAHVDPVPPSTTTPPAEGEESDEDETADEPRNVPQPVDEELEAGAATREEEEEEKEQPVQSELSLILDEPSPREVAAALTPPAEDNLSTETPPIPPTAEEDEAIPTTTADDAAADAVSSNEEAKEHSTTSSTPAAEADTANDDGSTPPAEEQE